MFFFIVFTFFFAVAIATKRHFNLKAQGKVITATVLTPHEIERNRTVETVAWLLYEYGGRSHEMKAMLSNPMQWAEHIALDYNLRRWCVYEVMLDLDVHAMPNPTE